MDKTAVAEKGAALYAAPKILLSQQTNRGCLSNP